MNVPDSSHSSDTSTKPDERSRVEVSHILMVVSPESFSYAVINLFAVIISYPSMGRSILFCHKKMKKKDYSHIFNPIISLYG